MSGGGRTRWIFTGVFLLYSVLIVAATEVFLPAAVIYPAVYYLYAQRVPFRWPLAAACVPLLLALIPAFTMNVLVYCVLLVSAMTMQLFLKRGRIGLAVGVPSVIIFGIVMAGVLSIARESGTAFMDVIAGWAEGVVNESRKASESMMSGAELQEFQDMLAVMQARIVTLFPSIVLTGSAFVLWLNLVFISFRRKGLPLREWKSPDWMIAGFIIAGILSVLPVERFSDIGFNLLIVVGQVYFFQGLAIVAVFMGEKAWPVLIRWPIYILILIQIYMMVIVAGLGLFDAWFDFRKRIRTPKGDRE